MAPHSSTLAWKIPRTEEPGGLQSMGLLSRTRLSDFTFTFHFHALEKEMETHSSVLAWRIPGMGEPGGLPSMGSYRVGHNWSDLAAAAADILSLACAQSLQLCLTLCSPLGHRPPGSCVHGILQARILEWVAISSSPGGLPNPGNKPASPTSPALHTDSKFALF